MLGVVGKGSRQGVKKKLRIRDWNWIKICKGMQLVQIASQEEGSIRDGTKGIEVTQIAFVLWLEQSLEILTQCFSTIGNCI